MILSDFVEIMHSGMGLKNRNGTLMGKAAFLRELLCLNVDNTMQQFLFDSPDSTFTSYIKRGLSKEVSIKLLEVLEQSEFIKSIDDLSDEQQNLIYQRLKEYNQNVDYLKLSQSCADLIKDIIINSTSKHTNTNTDFTLSSALYDLKRYWEKQKRGYVIHYACTYFDDPVLPARITCIAYRSLSNATTKSFSIFAEAQQLHMDTSDIPNELDQLELNMLVRFFESIQSLNHPIWFHWNMRSSKYGFEAIMNRYHFLSDQAIKQTDQIIESIFSERVDLGDYLKRIYGNDYADHPRLQNVCSYNHISQLDFITGKDEAKAFQEGKYNTISNSTLRKVSCIYELIKKCVNKSLKTKDSNYQAES